MSNVKIFTDSTSDLSKELIEKYNISIIPLYVNFDTISYKDGIEITTEELYKKVDEDKKLPLTSAPSPSDFIDAFKPYIDSGMDILYIGLSSKLSSTIQNAHLAAKEFAEGRIEIVDSLNVCLGIGILTLKAADYRDEGKSLPEIAALIREKVLKVRVLFIIDTLDYLHKGGRCSGVQNFVGGILKIRPIVKMEGGKIILWEKLRGKREKGLLTVLNKTLADKNLMDLDRVFVAHSAAPEDARYLEAELKISVEINKLYIENAGCVISSHCGPKTVGIIYMLK
jgi:DegV family protein with EDD domain